MDGGVSSGSPLCVDELSAAPFLCARRQAATVSWPGWLSGREPLAKKIARRGRFFSRVYSAAEAFFAKPLALKIVELATLFRLPGHWCPATRRNPCGTMLDPREALIFAAGAVGGATLLHCYNQRRMGRGPTTCPGGGGGGTTTVPSLQRSSGGGGAAVPTDAEGDYAAAHALVGRCESRCAATCAAQARTRAATMLLGTRPVSTGSGDAANHQDIAVPLATPHGANLVGRVAVGVTPSRCDAITPRHARWRGPPTLTADGASQFFCGQ